MTLGIQYTRFGADGVALEAVITIDGRPRRACGQAAVARAVRHARQLVGWSR